MSSQRLLASLAIAAVLFAFGAASPALAQPSYLGDVDGDNDVDLADLAALLSSYFRCTGDPLFNADADFNENGCVELSDLATLLAYYGTSFSGDMAIISSGEFEMGDPFSEGAADELPVHAVYLSTYYIDRYQITNQQYADALNWAYAQGGLITISSGVVHQYGGASYEYWDTTSSSTHSRIVIDGSAFTVTTGNEDHPVVNVSWYGAAAYCNWRSAMEGRPLCYNLSNWNCDFGASGFRLPTEAEWEKTAGWDPVQQRHYRFGERSDGCGYDCLDGHRANYSGSGDPYVSGASPDTTPVGFYNGELHLKSDFGWPGSETSYQTQDAQSYYGCYDMSGNVFDWCNDWYGDDYYDSSPSIDPPGPTSGPGRVVRGGGWSVSPAHGRSANRAASAPVSGNNLLGFRCVLGEP